tara:strand:+ start:564 stop:1118 length:555 start_codon:yes stop_codon:yes gene_type:complete
MITEKIEDAIVVYNNIVDPIFCERCVEYIDHVCKKSLATKAGDTDYREVSGHSLTKKTISEQIYFKKIYDEIFHFYSTYRIKFPRLEAAQINQIDLLKYNTGGKYLYHTDEFHGTPRSLSVIINLNDDYEGGDLVFAYQYLNKEMKRVPLKKGSICFFPSNFLYPHMIEPITKGTRYSIVAWLT